MAVFLYIKLIFQQKKSSLEIEAYEYRAANFSENLGVRFSGAKRDVAADTTVELN